MTTANLSCAGTTAHAVRRNSGARQSTNAAYQMNKIRIANAAPDLECVAIVSSIVAISRWGSATTPPPRHTSSAATPCISPHTMCALAIEESSDRTSAPMERNARGRAAVAAARMVPDQVACAAMQARNARTMSASRQTGRATSRQFPKTVLQGKRALLAVIRQEMEHAVRLIAPIETRSLRTEVHRFLIWTAARQRSKISHLRNQAAIPSAADSWNLARRRTKRGRGGSVFWHAWGPPVWLSGAVPFHTDV